MIKLLSLTASPSPGPEPLTWDRVREGVSWFFSNLSPAFVWPLFGLLIVAAFFAYYWWCLRPRPRSLEWIALAEEKSAPRRLTLTLKHHPMERGDALPLLLLTAVYALTAFFQLGDFNAPQSMVKFQQGDSYEFSYGQPVTVDTVSYYTSLGTGYYTLEWEGEDGQWHSLRLDQPYNSLFKWRVLDLGRNIDQNGLEITKDNNNLDAEPLGSITAARFRITASSAPRDEGLWLSELALWSGGKALPQPDHVDEGTAALFDEHELWSDRYTYMNSTYFDEIYHPRTAYEHLNNVYPYEVSHPPLGKLIISIGIAMFGMVPFGWRFMGTLFGVLMVPILYVFLKNLFGKTPVALCGAALFTFDFMHLVQTRIATIDTYGVFFILVSYYFMYRWLAVPAGKKLRHYILPLFLSGLFWGIGCASKWTVVYAGAGLALLWLLGMIFKAGDWHEAELAAQTQPVPPEVRREVTEAMFREEQPAWTPPRVPSFTAHAWGTVGLSVVFFVLIPVCVYTLSYFPYAVARGNDPGFLGLVRQCLTWPAGSGSACRSGWSSTRSRWPGSRKTWPGRAKPPALPTGSGPSSRPSRTRAATRWTSCSATSISCSPTTRASTPPTPTNPTGTNGFWTPGPSSTTRTSARRVCGAYSPPSTTPWCPGRGCWPSSPWRFRWCAANAARPCSSSSPPCPSLCPGRPSAGCCSPTTTSPRCCSCASPSPT